MKRFYNQKVWQRGGKSLFALLFALAILPSAAVASGVESDSGAAVAAVAAQQPKSQTVKGRVTDAETGEPIIGAMVLVKGTSIAVATDVNGDYSIRFTERNAVLEFKYSGYVSEEVPVGTQESINVALKSDAKDIDDVVVTAHGVQRKASVVGAQATVKVDNLKSSSGKLSTQLAGQMAGVVSVQSSGEPGSGAAFYIRGIATLAGANKPLVLVDGIERDLDLVNTEDIESFSVLKDASASAVYGVRGANGVILINTKRGADGKPVINAKYEYGLVSPDRMPKLANAYDFATLYNDAVGYGHFTDLQLAQYQMAANDPRRDANLYPNVDWLGELFNNSASKHQANISVSGGSKVARYYIGGSFNTEGSIFKEDKARNNYSSSVNYEKFSFRANLDVNIFPTTVVSLNIANMFETKRGPADQGNVWGYGFITSPTAFPKYYTDDNGDWLAWAGPSSGSGTNAYNALMNSGYYENFTNNTQATIGLKHSFTDALEGLSLNVKYAWDAINRSEIKRTKTVEQFLAVGRKPDGSLDLTRTVEGSGNTLGYEAKRNGDDYQKSYLEASINYEKLLGKKQYHRLGALVLYNHQIRNLVAAGSNISSLPYKTQGLAARVTYGFRDRYFLEFNVGYNGSENFSPGKRFGLFPSISLGWLLSEEKFMQALKPTISLLKIRGSVGKVGNDQIGGNRRFIYNATVNTDAGNYSGLGSKGGGYNVTGIAEGDVANPSVGWEESMKYDVGLELEMFKGALKLQADYFYEKRSGIFWPKYSLSMITGITTTPYVNVGEMDNRGVDASLSFEKQFGEVMVTARGTFSYNRNKVLNDEQPWAYPYLETIGKPFNQPKLLIAEGLFRDQADINASAEQGFGAVRPGDIKYRDINGDGIINANDRVAIGYAGTPEITWGAGATVAWKGFELQFLFQGTDNANFNIGARSLRPFAAGNLEQSAFNQDIVGNIWTNANPNPNAMYPRVSLSASPNNNEGSTFWQRNRAYVRLKNAEISYTLPRSVLDKLRLSSIRVFVQGSNLLTFSDFKLWDPETGTADGASYPNNRVFTVGVQVVY